MSIRLCKNVILKGLKAKTPAGCRRYARSFLREEIISQDNPFVKMRLEAEAFECGAAVGRTDELRTC